MADEKKGGNEPQSYGSQKDWLTGNTGQTVDQTAEKSDRHDEEFYKSRHGQTEADPGNRSEGSE